MTELLLLVAVVGAVSFWFGWKTREFYALRYIRRLRDQALELAADIPPPTMIQVTKEGETFLIHDQKTGEFLAQGTSHKEITKVLNDRFPQRTFIAQPANLREVGYDHDSL